MRFLPHSMSVILLGAGLLMIAPSCVVEQHPGPEMQELVCDSDGCKLCEGLNCSTYYCDTMNQCPGGFKCTSQGLCKPANGAGQQGSAGHPGGSPGNINGNDEPQAPADDPPEHEQPSTDPEPEPATPECEEAAQCDKMQECMEGVCVEKEPVEKEELACLFNSDCGPDGLCMDGDCHFACTDAGACPVTQVCHSNICLPSTQAAAECVFGADCSTDALCINAACIPLCEAPDDCGANELCASGLCTPDTAPKAQCLAANDCDQGLACVEGRCLAPCGPSGSCDEGFACNFGFCNPIFECRHSDECEATLVCIDGSCSSLELLL